MGWLDRVGNLFKRAAPSGSAASLEGAVMSASFGVRGPPKKGTRELIAAYKESPWLRAVTSRIADGVAGAEWHMYARAAEPITGRAFGSVAPTWRHGVDRPVRDLVLATGDRRSRARRRRELSAAGLLREVPDHPLLEVLSAPNDDMTGRSALKLTQTWLDIKGEAFWLLQYDKLGVLAGYLPVPPHWVIYVPTRERPTFRLSAAALQVELKPEMVFWLRDPDPENPYGRGTGVAESLADELETDEFAAKYLKSWFYNNGMPSGIVSFEGASLPALKDVKERWEQEHRGIGNGYRMHFASGKMNVARLDASFKDQQLSELRRGQRDTIAQVFAVPPEIIGIIENSNRSTIDAARNIYVTGVEFPRVERLRSEMQFQLVKRFDENLVLEAELAVPEDQAHTLSVMTAQPAAFSLNEWREEAQKEPLLQFVGVFPPLAQPGQAADNPGNDDPAPEPDPSPPEITVGDDDAPEPPEPDPSPPERARAIADPPWANALALRPPQ